MDYTCCLHRIKASLAPSTGCTEPAAIALNAATARANITGEIKRIVDECYDKAKALILEHEDVLHKCCELLMEREKIGQEEFEALF